jgi:hypothetical protein
MLCLVFPLTELDTEIFESARDHILWALPLEVVQNGSNVQRLSINLSRRLSPDTVHIVQPALYPGLPFNATSTDMERHVRFAAAGVGGDQIERALDLVAAGASIVAIQLPDLGFEVDVDEDMCGFCRVKWHHKQRQVRHQSPDRCLTRQADQQASHR